MEEKKKGSYVLVDVQRMEELLKNQFMMSQSVLLFEYLCSPDTRYFYRPRRPARCSGCIPRRWSNATANEQFGHGSSGSSFSIMPMT